MAGTITNVKAKGSTPSGQATSNPTVVAAELRYVIDEYIQAMNERPPGVAIAFDRTCLPVGSRA